MPPPDAAPLPRLGEVFFDVRGDSRSMRLSWYSDTGVAVFSIWQGGRCTGTFRLPMDDLSRMIEILQRGPQGRRSRLKSVSEDYQLDDYGAGYGPGEHGTDDYSAGDYSAGGYGAGDYGAGDYGAGDYGGDEYAANEHAAGDYRVDEYRADEYADDQGTSVYASGRHSPYRQEQGGYRSDFTGQERFGENDSAGYGQERIVPPYLNDNRVSRQSRRGDIGSSSYPAARQPRSQRSERYLEPDPPSGGYSGSQDYRSATDSDAAGRHSAGKHSGQPDWP
jgi:hypothetical protein